MKFSKRGDGGETSLLGGQRVLKCDARPDTYGTLDEAGSVLGVARAMTGSGKIKGIILDVQKDLLILGAELSAMPDDCDKLGKVISQEDIRRLEEIIEELQKNIPWKNEFVYPGQSVVSAQIDVGRTVIRRAERKAAVLKRDGFIIRAEIRQYLNRLADMLFVLARYDEQKGKSR
jgi:cob(I)alamin adenosyltransferase